jgi:hypothetical protein
MFAQALGKATDLFGKAFLLAGLVPAAVVLLGLWILGAGSAAVGQIRALLDSPTASGIALALLVLLALASMLFVLRARVIGLLESLSWRGLTALRESLIARQLRRALREDRERERWTETYTAMDWCMRGFPSGPQPTGLRVPYWCAVAKASRRGRAALSRFLVFGQQDDVIDARLARRLGDGLLALRIFALAHPSDARAAQEIDAWRRMLAGPDSSVARSALEQAQADCHRQWFLPWKQASKLPDRSQMQPTQIGNLMASLGTYAQQRYGISADVLWPRLWCVLPEGERKEVTDLRLQCKALGVLWLCMGILAVAALFFLARVAFVPHADLAESMTQIVVALLVFALAAAGMSLCCGMTALSVEALVDRIKALVDVHHVRLLRSLGLQPADTGEAIRMLAELEALITSGSRRVVVRPLSTKD